MKSGYVYFGTEYRYAWIFQQRCMDMETYQYLCMINGAMRVGISKYVHILIGTVLFFFSFEGKTSTVTIYSPFAFGRIRQVQ